VAGSKAFATTSFPVGPRDRRSALPRVEHARDAFEARGFVVEAFDTLEQEIDPSLAAHYDRVARRALSSFELITEAEFEQGLELMRLAADRETIPTPVRERIDLLGLCRKS
jgi:hypothetical protein